MYLSYFDSNQVTPASIKRGVGKLKKYRDKVNKVVATKDSRKPEYSLIHAANPDLHQTLAIVEKKFSKIKHLVLIGIGGSNLGTEAVHAVLDTGKVKLSSLDTISAHDLELLINELKQYRTASKIAVCVISKSGNTAETLSNAGVLLDALSKKFGKNIYQQTVFIGNPGTDLMKTGKRLGAMTIPMPEIVGGRYSVTTEVGLVPLVMLGHNVDSFIEGIIDAGADEFEELTAESASRIYSYISKNYHHYSFFAFEKRLYSLGAWYRQLYAESLGKTKDKSKKPVTKGMLPTVSTAVELHSVGQLFLSGYAGVYTDFVTFDDDTVDFDIPKKGVSKAYGRFTAQEITTGIYGGVIGAYQEKKLAYRSTILDDNLPYALGLFMTMRMREVMYVANLMNLNAFDQPNVELYKNKTRAILKI